jgi:hypothetical protein
MVAIQLLLSKHSPDSWRLTPICTDAFHVLITGVSFIISRISSSTSEVVDFWCPLLATWAAKFPRSQRQHTFPYLDIIIMDICLGTNDGPPQHYCLPNCTWNAYSLALDLSTTSQQLAITKHLTYRVRQANFLFWIWNAIWKRKLACRTLYNHCTLLLRFGNYTRLCRTNTMIVFR